MSSQRQQRLSQHWFLGSTDCLQQLHLSVSSHLSSAISFLWTFWVSFCLCAGRGDTTGGRGRDPVLYFASPRRGYHFLEDIKFPSLCLGSWSFHGGGMGVWIRLIEGGGSWVGAGGMG